jgi:hypothetical protein
VGVTYEGLLEYGNAQQSTHYGGFARVPVGTVLIMPRHFGWRKKGSEVCVSRIEARTETSLNIAVHLFCNTDHRTNSSSESMSFSLTCSPLRVQSKQDVASKFTTDPIHCHLLTVHISTKIKPRPTVACCTHLFHIIRACLVQFPRLMQHVTPRTSRSAICVSHSGSR